LRCGARPSEAGTADAALKPVFEHPVARFWQRGLAQLLDLILLWRLFKLVWTGVGFATQQLTRQGAMLTGPSLVIAILIYVLLVLAYFTLMEGLMGATLGKAIVGLRVLQLDDEPVGLMSAFIRNALRPVDAFAGYLVGIFVAMGSKLRQRLGDRLAGTYVIENVVENFMGGSRFGPATVWFFVVALLLICNGMTRRVAPAWAYADRPRVVNLTLHTRGGALQPPGKPFSPSETVFAQFTLTGMRANTSGPQSMAVRVTAFDPSGLQMTDAFQADLGAQTMPGDDITGAFKLDLPSYAPAGVYRFELRALDTAASTESADTQTFTVAAPVSAPANDLEVRNVRFWTSQSASPESLGLALLPGATVFMTGRLYGVQFDGNDMDVRIGVRLLTPDGKTISEDLSHQIVKHTYRYHPQSFWLPLETSFKIPENVSHGIYSQEFIVKDMVAVRNLTETAHLVVR
jgi:uncharacterized RDD family membrane protein YckC